MAKRKSKKSSITRRDLLKTAIAGAVVVPLAPLAMKSKEAKAADEIESASVWRKYSLSISLQVPRIYANNESLGYRKYQT